LLADGCAYMGYSPTMQQEKIPMLLTWGFRSINTGLFHVEQFIRRG
jgi:hypothetical protein